MSVSVGVLMATGAIRREARANGEAANEKGGS